MCVGGNSYWCNSRSEIIDYSTHNNKTIEYQLQKQEEYCSLGW